jgi:hypothetical protein
MFETIVVLTNAFIANIPLDKVFLALLYHIMIYNAYSTQLCNYC